MSKGQVFFAVYQGPVFQGGPPLTKAILQFVKPIKGERLEAVSSFGRVILSLTLPITSKKKECRRKY